MATSASRFTELQGQYLAFIHAYTLVNGRAPAEADMQRFFGVTPPSVHNMVKITLANINTLCAMSHQTSHLGVLVIRPEVEVLSALSLLALIKPDEVQPRQATRLRADLELLSRGVDHNPTKSLGPPLPQGHRIYRVNNHLLPFQGHPPNLDLPGLQEQAFGSEKTLVTDYVLSRRAPLVTVVESTDDGAGQLRSRP